MRMKSLKHNAFVLGAVVLAGCGPELPPHVVADDTSLAPIDGRRVRLSSSDSDLTKDQCVALINAYRKKAGPEGQVSVHKPSKILKGALAAWCIENFDGRGVVFQTDFFPEDS